MNAAQPRDTLPTISSGSMSLNISATTIAEGAVRLLTCFANFTLYTTICSVSDLCVVNCSSFVDLLFDEIKCVHCRSPKGWDLSPVPSVVCAPVTLWHRVLYGLYQFDLNFWFQTLMLLNPKNHSISIWAGNTCI